MNPQFSTAVLCQQTITKYNFKNRHSKTCFDKIIQYGDIQEARSWIKLNQDEGITFKEIINNSKISVGKIFKDRGQTRLCNNILECVLKVK